MNEKYIMFYNFGIFIIMIPILFKAFMAFDLDKFFKKRYTWEKQVIYFTFVVIFAKLFADVFSSLGTMFLNMSG
ncbi:hypothetical protein KHQ82_04290 [Mycoplasmatota bacterium]|nr:hypothetical protein KHQ82_04290 [Mycoplasmatota bacterium]